MQNSDLITIVWILGILLQGATLAVITRRKMWARVPAFGAYTLYHMVLATSLFAVRNVYSVYFWGHWIGNGVGFLLGMLAIWEIYRACLQRYDALRNFASLIFLAGTAVLLAVSIGLALASPGSDASRIVGGVLLLERSVRVVQLGLVVLIFAGVALLRTNWPRVPLGIALGFGIYLGVELCAVAVRAETGSAAQSMFAMVSPLAYLGTLVLWTSVLLRSEQVATVRGISAEQLDRWNESLTGFLRTR